MTGVSAEWVDDTFTSLRVTVPEGGTYRISYSAVNKSNDNNSCTPGSRVIMAGSVLHTIIDELNSNCFYTLSVEIVSSEFMELVNESVGVGECMHIIFLLFLC